MNLKKTFASLAGCLVMIASPGVVGAQVGESSSNGGVVEIESAGTFNVTICQVDGDVDFGTVGVSTVDSGTASASLFICFEDTHTFRSGWTTGLSADGWTSSDAAYNTPLPASALQPAFAYSPLSTQLTPTYEDGGWIYGSNGLTGADNITNPTTIPASVTSRPWLAGNLGSPLGIGHADAGRGTTHTLMRLDLELTVPANTSPGTYTTELTVDLGERDAP